MNFTNKKIRNLLAALTALFICSISYSQVPVIEWQRSYGGGGDDYLYSVRQTTDSGYVGVGWTVSNSDDVTGNHGYLPGGYGPEEIWVIKVNSAGALQWQKTLGGFGNERAYCIRQTTDGGYIISGETSSNSDGDVTGHHTTSATSDCWIVKLDNQGNIQWQKCYGGSGTNEIAYDIVQTTDGGYIFAGSSNISDGDVTQNMGLQDFWTVKIDAAGTIQWQHSRGYSTTDYALSVKQTSDGGYVVGGVSYVNWLPSDLWLLKYDNAGMFLWQKSYGGSGYDGITAVEQTSDGGLIIEAYSGSNDSDITNSNGNYDFWIVKTDSAGNMQWQKSLGSSDVDWPHALVPCNDGGFIIAGYTQGHDSDVTFNHSAYPDYWVLKLDSSGTNLWQKTLGGTGEDAAFSVMPTFDGGYIVGGYAKSNNGDITNHYFGADYWLVKLGYPESVNEMENGTTVNIYPNPAKDEITVTIDHSLINEEYVLTDVAGKIILSGKLNNGINKIAIENLAQGLYLLRVGKTDQHSFKVVKE
jgi:hypothetical protein